MGNQMGKHIYRGISAKEFNPLRHRHWVPLTPLKRVPQSRKFRVMSFNMLNQSYMWPQVYDSYVPKEYRSWEYRVQLLQGTVVDSNIQSEIMCFQEMEGRAFERIWYPLMKELGYEGSFIQKGKPNYWAEDDDTALIDGVSIFYDTNKFALLECKKFGITDYYNTEFENWYGVDFNRKEISTMFSTRNQVGLIVVLQHYMTNETIIVLNTHLYWKLSDVKLLQTIVLLEALHKIKLKYTNSRILFTGDFNSRPDSSVYQFLKNDKIESSNKDISQYLNGSSKEFIVNPVETSSNIFDTIIQQDGLFTCYTQHLFGIFDYIWFNNSDFNLLGFLSGVDREYLKVIQGLPNRDFPSDHIPLVAEFEIMK